MHGVIVFHVEGDTEEIFVKRVLQPHFDQFNVYLQPIKVGKRKEIRGDYDRGGTALKELTLGEIKNSLSRSDVILVTTMLDYFRLHESYGKNEADGNNGIEKAEFIEKSLHDDLNNHQKFIPHLQVHDFEAILFSSPDVLTLQLGGSSKVKDHLRKIRNEFPSPELIDDQNCPAYRLNKVCREYLQMERYPKKIYGSQIALKIGLPEVRSKCSHFDKWLTKLEEKTKSV